jgi:hypothetical protein
VGGIELVLCRVATSEEQKPIVKRCNVGYPKDEMAAYPENSGHLMDDPKQLLGMFKDLVRDDDVDAFVRERQRVVFNVERENLLRYVF